MSLYEQETKINPIKFLPIKTDFINRDDMVVTQFDESQQTNEFLKSKFKFFKNETENLKMLRTNASSIYKPLITKSTNSEWNKFDKTISTKLTPRNNVDIKFKTNFNFNTKTPAIKFFDRNRRNLLNLDTQIQITNESKVGKSKSKLKLNFSNTYKDTHLYTYDIVETLPSVYDTLHENSNKLNRLKFLNANTNMSKYYENKNKPRKNKFSSNLNSTSEDDTNTQHIQNQKVLLTENPENNRKLYLKKIEFDFIKKNQRFGIFNRNTKITTTNSNTKSLFLDYLNSINKSYKNSVGTYGKGVTRLNKI
jgi:hypothetical protein